MGLVGFTRVLANEGRKYNIKANAIAPVAKTRMTEELLGAGGRPRRAQDGHPARRLPRLRGVRRDRRGVLGRRRPLRPLLHRPHARLLQEGRHRRGRPRPLGRDPRRRRLHHPRRPERRAAEDLRDPERRQRGQGRARTAPSPRSRSLVADGLEDLAGARRARPGRARRARRGWRRTPPSPRA